MALHTSMTATTCCPMVHRVHRGASSLWTLQTQPLCLTSTSHSWAHKYDGYYLLPYGPEAHEYDGYYPLPYGPQSYTTSAQLAASTEQKCLALIRARGYTGGSGNGSVIVDLSADYCFEICAQPRHWGHLKQLACCHSIEKLHSICLLSW
ncbi:hypothetical protein B0F90DRAFT_1668082 [Multifurca ochricompacta]|uniref:Uncharacterized protein n=1 Tax=Multifurca ochricompacta TaxID=376703 RepID=A0AAD4M3L0_9AGAM|nr:hypothetical protein B0F90DRAFT_1668082 [Multifurca ochricompacta]